MEHAFIKVDEIHDRYRIILQGGQDESRFGRVFNPSLLGSHALTFRIVDAADGSVKRKAIEIEMKPFSLRDIQGRSDDFAALSLIELIALVRLHKLTLKGNGDRPVEGDKLAMIEALRAAAQSDSKPAADPDRDALVIPPEIMAMGLADLQTYAGTLAVSYKGPGGRDVSIEVLRAKVAKKLASEPVGV